MLMTTYTITTNSKLNDRLASFLIDKLSENKQPVSSTQLAIWATTYAWKLVQDGVLDPELLDTNSSYRAPVREIGTSRINRILSTQSQAHDAGLRFEYGTAGRKLRHWTTKANYAALREHLSERSHAMAAIGDTVVVRERYNCFEVILDDKLPAAATFVYQRITAINNGEEIVEEVIPYETAKKFADDTARSIRRSRYVAAGYVA